MGKRDMAAYVINLPPHLLIQLFKVQHYYQIRYKLLLWVEWIEAQSDEEDWPLWQDCWESYRLCPDTTHNG